MQILSLEQLVHTAVALLFQRQSYDVGEFLGTCFWDLPLDVFEEELDFFEVEQCIVLERLLGHQVVELSDTRRTSLPLPTERRMELLFIQQRRVVPQKVVHCFGVIERNRVTQHIPPSLIQSAPYQIASVRIGVEKGEETLENGEAAVLASSDQSRTQLSLILASLTSVKYSQSTRSLKQVMSLTSHLLTAW